MPSSEKLFPRASFTKYPYVHRLESYFRDCIGPTPTWCYRSENYDIQYHGHLEAPFATLLQYITFWIQLLSKVSDFGCNVNTKHLIKCELFK